MARRRPISEEAQVPLSAMIDVVFLLLIYFIVTQKPIIDECYLGIDLPSPNQNPPPPEPPPPPAKIDVYGAPLAQDDEFIYQGTRYTYAQLRDVALPTITDPKTTIIVNVDRNSKHAKLVRLLDLLGKLKLNNLNLVTDEGISYKGK